jgi:signal transduction histidine kinase
MPYIDGLLLLEKVRERLPEAVIILMTGQATVESALRALKGGAYDYVIKPFKLEKIFRVVSQGLELQRLKRENLYLSEINRRFQEIDRVKSDLLAAITHEFRTPLTIMYGWLDLLLDEQFGQLTREQRESILNVRQSALRLGKLVSNLLAYVELERGVAEFRNQPVALGELISLTFGQLEPETQARKIEVTLHIANGIPMIEADPEKLQLVFFNLLENAIKFNERGGEVQVEVKSSHPFVEVSISNSGGEISRDQAAQFLQPLARWDVSASRTRGGLGLGLAVVKAVVEAYRGQLEIESGPGRRTTVRARLPVLPKERIES